MALKNNEERGSTIYLSVVGGKISQKVTKETVGAVERVNKNNVTVYEQHFNAIEGVLENIKFKQSNKPDIGDSYDVTFRDVDQLYNLNLPISGRITNGLLGRLPNIDLSSKIEFRVFNITDKETGKEKQFSSVYQNGEKVLPAFTKEVPNGLPPMELKKVKGKDVWDDSEQIEFFKALIAKTFADRPKAEVAQKSEASDNQEDTSDLPF